MKEGLRALLSSFLEGYIPVDCDQTHIFLYSTKVIVCDIKHKEGRFVRFEIVASLSCELISVRID